MMKDRLEIINRLELRFDNLLMDGSPSCHVTPNGAYITFTTVKFYFYSREYICV